MSDNITKRVGLGTAYGFAKAGGYDGTVEQFTELLGNIAIDLARIENLSVTVTTLPAGSQATASLNGSVLSLGIPKGDKGDKGNTGETGAPAGFGTVSATVDDNIGTPSVEVTASGADTAKNFAFAFHNLKGKKGDKGDTGEVSEAELTQAFEDFSANGTVANAEQLTTDIRANDQTPYLFRTAGGSVDIGDREYVNGIVGGSLAWNQMLPTISAEGWEGENGSSISVSGTIINTTFSSGSPNVYLPAARPKSILSFIAGHKYLGSVKFKSTKAGYPYYRSNAFGTSFPFSKELTEADVWKTYETVAVATQSEEGRGYFGQGNANVIGLTYDDVVSFKDMMFIDLTQMFGSTIADYIYSLEQATAGAGVAFFKTLFPKPYYAYNAGELKSVKGLVSHDMVGFNQFDKDTMLLYGYISDDTGEIDQTDPSSGYRCTDFIKVVPNQAYYIKTEQTNGLWGAWYDADKNFISGITSYSNTVKIAPNEAHYIRLTIKASQSGNPDTFCVNLSWDGSEDGNYEPYQKWSYPLDSDLELRGIPKIENGNLYYDGDVYEADGTVTRKYGIVDLGTLMWSAQGTDNCFYTTGIASVAKVPTDATNPNLLINGYTNHYAGYAQLANKEYRVDGNSSNLYIGIKNTACSTPAEMKSALSGVYLVYELATPTTETADPYTNPQIVNDFGTEEFVISNTVDVPIPVGHNTDYPVNLKAKVEMMPNSPDGDGDYIVRQTNGTNEYVSIANNATIQNILARLEALEG